VLFGVDTEKCKIITIVRNPYERAVSDLFYLKRITKDSSKSAVYGELRSYIARCPDNHGVPQYLFLIDSTGKIPQTIKIFKTETLTDDLRAYGFSDFDVKSNQGPGLDYYSYLNRASIALINERYMEDFQFFGYELIKLETAPST
jgi:hypothetical protein